MQLTRQKDFAQAAGLDWEDSDAKFQDPVNSRSSRRASVDRIAELRISNGPLEAVESWLQLITYTVLIGNNDAHAENFALLHISAGAPVFSDIYDAVPNLWRDGRITYNLALAINGEFDQRKITAENLIEQSATWGLGSGRAEEILSETITRFGDAISQIDLPDGGNPRMQDHVASAQTRLAAGNPIATRKRGKSQVTIVGFRQSRDAPAT